jgi:hypothetical protein
MCKPPREESNISIEEQTKKEPRETSLEVLVNEYSDVFKALAQHEEELVAVTQLLENDTKTSQQKREEATPTLLPTRFVDAEVMKTE